MNKEILALGLTFLVLALLVAPVMAMGPYQAYEIGHNRNVDIGFGGLLFLKRANAGGAIYTFKNTCGFWEKWKWFDASTGAGKFDIAIEATIPTLYQYAADKEAFCKGDEIVNENKWIYMSPNDPVTGSHGMIWMFFYLATEYNSDLADLVASKYPNGAYWMYNFVK